MTYSRIFTPPPDFESAPPSQPGSPAHSSLAGSDARDGRVYVHDENLVLAVNVALASGRPLLLRGPSGSGKSSLAPFIANAMKWRYYEVVINSRTRAQDLLYRFDTVRRLGDAHTGAPKTDAEYVEPEPLWWAYNRDSALKRGQTHEPGKPSVPVTAPTDPGRPGVKPGAVVLIDEIDKADPDMPNDLLVALGSREFQVTEIRTPVRIPLPPRTPETIARSGVLVVITTNEERQLPTAFLRRCVIHILDHPDKTALIQIAGKHFGRDHEALYDPVAAWIVDRQKAARAAGEPEPSTAEFLDAILACIHLGIDENHTSFRQILQMAGKKSVDLETR